MKQAEKMCESVSEDLKPQALVLAEALITLQKKIEQQTPAYKMQSFVQEVTVGTGETILRSNPFTQEYRATIREYAQTLKAFNELIGKKQDNQQRTDKNSKLHIVGNSKWKKQA